MELDTKALLKCHSELFCAYWIKRAEAAEKALRVACGLIKCDGCPIHDKCPNKGYGCIKELMAHFKSEIMGIFQDEQAEIIQDVIEERIRQDAKWGEQNHFPQFWTGILGEEYGELCQAINETVFENGSDKGGYENMRREAVHVAAVAIGFLECLERNKDNWAVKP
jgi:hypothetical protein